MPTVQYYNPAQKDETKGNELSDSLMQKLVKQKTVAFDFQERRHENWDDNYELYRNKVRTNRLTQRQAVNIPLMKETIKTILSKIDDPPSITFKEKTGDMQKELFLQARWDEDADRLNYEGVDIQDKKTTMLYGRAFKKLNFLNDEFDIDALDIYDVIVDPMVNPLNIETARFLIHQNIFRSLREVLANPNYTKKGKKELNKYLSMKEGIIQSQANQKALEAKQERLKAMGVEDKDFAHFQAGDTILNLSEHYPYLWDPKIKEFVRYVVVYVDDRIRLLKEPLKKMLGVDFLPFVTWGDDVETQDIWSDGPADLVRVPNKVLNIWFSQMIENRTLKNFQMHWYDSTQQGYQPQTYTPGAGKMLPAPGNPKDTIMPVNISGLEDTLTMIDFLIKLVEKGTSTTATEKGVSEKKQITLGEVEMLVGKSMEMTMSMAKFYRRSWKELASKWYKILDANDGKTRTLYKTSSKGKIWSRKIKPIEWKSKEGYQIISKSSSEQEAENVSGLQKLMAVKQQFPDNPALQRIIQRRTLEIIDLTPDELREVEEFEKKKAEQPQIQVPEMPGQQENQMADGIMKGVRELEGLTSRT